MQFTTRVVVVTRRCIAGVVDVIVKFADADRALRFEKYLKTGSGCKFAKRHLR